LVEPRVVVPVVVGSNPTGLPSEGYGRFRDSRRALPSCLAIVGPCCLTVLATAGPCFFADRPAASRIARRCAGGIRFHPRCAFIAISRILNPGIYPEA
jgi:hypothetical protein